MPVSRVEIEHHGDNILHQIEGCMLEGRAAWPYTVSIVIETMLQYLKANKDIIENFTLSEVKMIIDYVFSMLP